GLLESPAPAQVGEVDHEARLDEAAAHLLDQPDRGGRGPAGGDEIVHQQDRLSGRDGVEVHLDPVGAVLELVVITRGLPRELAPLADRDEAGAEAMGDRPAEDEPPSLDPRDLRDALSGVALGEAVDGAAEP